MLRYSFESDNILLHYFYVNNLHDNKKWNGISVSFLIPTDSMQPTLQPGDNILVNKCIMGARIFDVWEAVEDKEVDIYRLPGIGKVKRGDVLCWCFTIPIRIVTTAFQCTC